LLNARSAQATSYTWTGGSTTSNNWSDVANWGASGYPSASGDVATITNVASGQPTLDVAVAITSLTIGGNVTLTLSNNLTLSGTLTIKGNETLSLQTTGSGDVLTAASITFNSSNAALNVAANISISCTALTLGSSTTINNSGSITAGSDVPTTSPNTITNQSSGTFKITGALTIPSGSSVTNYGIFSVGGTTTLKSTSSIDNLSGTFTTLGNIAIASGCSISNTALFYSSGGAITFANSQAGITNNSGGTFYIYDNATVAFGSKGFIKNDGIFYAGESGSACTLNLNANTAVITNTGTFYLGSTSVINITVSGASVSNSGTFTIQSDANGSGAIGQITGTTPFSGTYNVERYISAERGYRLLSSPVYSGTDANSNKVYSLSYLASNLYLTGSGSGFPYPGNPTLYLYNEGFVPQFSTFLNSNFIGVSTLPAGSTPAYGVNSNGAGLTGTYTIPVGNGYYCFFRGNLLTETAAHLTTPSYTPVDAATVTASGTLNQGQVTFKDWYTPTSTTLGSTNQNFNLIGNPYACAIDLEQVSSSSTTTGIYVTALSPLVGGITANSITRHVYELNPVSGVYGVYTIGGGTSYPPTNGASEYIASGQGFFVQAYGSTKLIFNESGKATSGNAAAPGLMARRVEGRALAAVNNMPAGINAALLLKMSLDTINNEESLIVFNPAAQTAYQPGEDAAHKTGPGLVGFSSISSDNIPMAVNSLPLQRTQTIPLKVYAANDGQYKIDLSQPSPLPALYDIWLKDTYTKDSLDIKHNPGYRFNISTADTSTYGAYRLSLVIRQNPALMVHLLNFGAAKAPEGDQVSWVTENEATYTNFTVERSTDGKTFDELAAVTSSAQGSYGYLDKTPANGPNTYRLKITDLNGAVSYSSVVTIMYANTNGKIALNGVTVYPNPTANTINLSITGNQAGNTAMTPATTKPAYNIEIVNNMGSVVKSEKSSSPLWQSDVTALTPGTYFVRVIDTGNNTVVGKSAFVKL